MQWEYHFSHPFHGLLLVARHTRHGPLQKKVQTILFFGLVVHREQLSRSLQHHQGYVILLLPALAGKALQFAEHEIDEWRPIGMLCEQGLEARKAEHLTPVIMSLYQAVAVEKQALSRRQHCFVFIVTCARQQTKRHASRPEFCGATTV